MLFTNNRLTLRFSRYLTNHSNNGLSAEDSVIDISSCYQLLGEAHQDDCCSELPNITQRIVTAYEKRTGRWLEADQVALAAIHADIQNQAKILHHHFASQHQPNATLHCSAKTSYLRMALLADSLKLSRFSTAHTPLTDSQLPHCKRMLNVLLDDVCMADIEESGRALRKRCIKTLTLKGIHPDSLQACWHLRMRYQNSQTSLLLKCMPINMMHDVFEAQHKAQFGFSLSGEPIVIEALEIDVKVTAECQPGVAANNPYLDAIMSQWERDSDESATWVRSAMKPDHKAADIRFLECPVLKEILAKYIAKPVDLAMPNFFIKNFKKAVDEAAIDN